jgi:hypothetical protein
MAEPLLTDIFGAGATQNASSITLLKADLPLTAGINNRAEQILAAIVKKASLTLTPANYGTNPDQSVNMAAGFDSLVYRTDTAGVTTTHLQTQIAVNFSKPQATSGITPDDY